MLRSAKELENFSIGATDGPIGKVKDFYFDDRAWTVRYLVVETGSWLSNRRVLIAPASLGELDIASSTIPADLTCAQVRDSPSMDTHKPISRQQEETLLTYYGHAYYWGGTGLIGSDSASGLLLPAAAMVPPLEAVDVPRSPPGDPHLRSCAAVSGYHVHASDGDIGHVDGMLFDSCDWRVRFFIIDTSNWWLGYRVLVATDLVTEVDWGDSKVTVQLSRESVKDSHVYDESLRDADGNIGIRGGD